MEMCYFESRPVKRANTPDSESSGANLEDLEFMPPAVPHSLKKSASKSPAKSKINKRSIARASSLIPSATFVISVPSSSQHLPSLLSEIENVYLSTNVHCTEVSEESHVLASQEYYSKQQTRGMQVFYSILKFLLLSKLISCKFSM
jgi:BRCT domain type II-containing protein